MIVYIYVLADIFNNITIMGNCFESFCNCSCNSQDPAFDNILKEETNFQFTLYDICHSNIGWFTDTSLCSDHYLAEWPIDSSQGIYFLWHKDAYCDKHNMFHMKCLYVGKGYILQRIITHFKTKDFSQEMLVYFTYFKLNNRQSKYVEQLVLDIYNIPHNINEKEGTNKLCMHFTQNEVD